VLGSWGFTGNDLPLGVDMLYRTRNKYPWLEMQTLYPFSEEGIGRAVADAMAMKTVKSTIMPCRNWRSEQPGASFGGHSLVSDIRHSSEGWIGCLVDRSSDVEATWSTSPRAMPMSCSSLSFRSHKVARNLWRLRHS